MNKLNLNFYKNEELYSDGDIENEILDIVKKNRDFYNILSNDNRWPILYHLSPDRRNLLEWYHFNKQGILLEIGAGCGALTGLFCEKVKKVVAVEFSKRRVEIIQARYRNLDNLEIIAGNISDIIFTDLFDYITLIGVFEYTKSFLKSPEPYKLILNKIKSLLKDDGILIIAIENKFGLKYFAGAREEHTGNLFDGIEGYIKNNSVETFGKDEITDLLINNGYKDIKFYYPYPDYKLPIQIFSNKYLPEINNILPDSSCYAKNRIKLFSERLAFMNIIKNNKFDFFSNSFLIIATNGDR